MDEPTNVEAVTDREILGELIAVVSELNDRVGLLLDANPEAKRAYGHLLELREHFPRLTFGCACHE